MPSISTSWHHDEVMHSHVGSTDGVFRKLAIIRRAIHGARDSAASGVITVAQHLVGA